MKTLNKVLLISLVASAVFAQQTTTQTTLSAALAGSGTSAPAPTTLCLTSSTGVSAPGFGTPSNTGIMVDKEYMPVLAATSSTSCWTVLRGASGTSVQSHVSGAVAWVGPTGGGSALGIVGASPFTNVPPVQGTACVSTAQPYLPRVILGSEGYQLAIGWIANCLTTGPGANTWSLVHTPIQPYLEYYTALDAGANNAVTASIPGLTQATGSCVSLVLAHTLQAGADTFALNGATAVAIKSHYNQATNIATAYAVTGTANLCYNGTVWLDMAQ